MSFVYIETLLPPVLFGPPHFSAKGPYYCCPRLPQRQHYSIADIGEQYIYIYQNNTYLGHYYLLLYFCSTFQKRDLKSHEEGKMCLSRKKWRTSEALEMDGGNSAVFILLPINIQIRWDSRVSPKNSLYNTSDFSHHHII